MLFQTSLEVNAKWLKIFAKADVLGRICDDKEELLYKLELFEEFCREQNCWGNPRQFSSDLAMFNYFSKDNVSPDYEPFDNLKSEVIMLSGLPGSGKDFFIKKNYSDLPVVSLDNLRRKLKNLAKGQKRNRSNCANGQGRSPSSSSERRKFHLERHQYYAPITQATD